MTTDEVKALPIEQVYALLERNAVNLTSGPGFPTLGLMHEYHDWRDPFDAGFSFRFNGQAYSDGAFANLPAGEDRQKLIDRVARLAAETLVGVNPEAR